MNHTIDPATLQMTIGIMGLAGGVVVATWGISWGLGKRFSSVWKRFDELKEHVEERFQPQRLCDVQHQALGDRLTRIENDVTEIKSDVKKVLQNGHVKKV